MYACMRAQLDSVQVFDLAIVEHYTSCFKQSLGLLLRFDLGQCPFALTWRLLSFEAIG